MGKLITKLGLPKKILLQGWAGDQGNNDINGEYTFIGNDSAVPSWQNIYVLSTLGGGPAIYFDINENRWGHNSDDTGWINSSTNPNELPLTGWVEVNAQGPAGTITPILTNTKNISIKKQNLGGGRLLAPKLDQRIIPYFLINVNGVFTNSFYDAGNSATVVATITYIRFFTHSTTSNLNTIVDASGNFVQAFGSTFIDLYYPNAGTYTITLTQPGNAFYKPATPLTITITVLPPPSPPGSGSSGAGIGGGGV